MSLKRFSGLFLNGLTYSIFFSIFYISISHAADDLNDPYIYALTLPQRDHSRLGLSAQIAHLAVEPAIQIGKSIGAYYAANHSLIAFFAMFIPEMFKTPSMITLQSYGDLQLRFYFSVSNRVQPAFRLPGKQVIKLVTASGLTYRLLFLVTEKESTGFVFLLSDIPVAQEDWQKATNGEFGNLIPIAKDHSTRVEFEFQNGEGKILDAWTTTPNELFQEKVIPLQQLQKWIELFKADKKHTRLTAKLITPQGTENWGTIAEGVRLKALLGLGFGSWALRKSQEILGRRRPGSSHAKIPISTIVEGGLRGIVKIKCIDLVHQMSRAVLKAGELAPFRGADRFNH